MLLKFSANVWIFTAVRPTKGNLEPPTKSGAAFIDDESRMPTQLTWSPTGPTASFARLPEEF